VSEGGGGSGAGGGVGVPIVDIVNFFQGLGGGPTGSQKAVKAFENQLRNARRRSPGLTDEQVIAGLSDRRRNAFFNQGEAIARSQGMDFATFLLRFLPQVTLEQTRPVFEGPGNRPGRGRSRALEIPNIHRLAQIELGLAGPIPPRAGGRLTRDGVPIDPRGEQTTVNFPPNFPALLRILLGQLFPGRDVFTRGRARPRRTQRPRQTLDPLNPARRRMPLIDTFERILSGVTQASATVIPQLQNLGVLPPPLFGMPGSGLQVQQAGFGALGSAILRQLPAIAGGVALGEGIEAVQGAGQVGAGCVVPSLRMSARLPRTHDVPVTDQAGNVVNRTYVLAPRVSYKISVRPRRRHHHHPRR